MVFQNQFTTVALPDRHHTCDKISFNEEAEVKSRLSTRTRECREWNVTASKVHEPV
jgi:hypothetical protein